MRGVFARCFFERRSDANVIHHDAAGLVAENAIHARDGLHQVVSLHWLVHVQRMQRGNVRACQPHVADDDEFQRVVNVFETRFDFFAAFFGGDMPRFVPRGWVLRQIACHYDFDLSRVVGTRVPFGAQRDNFIKEGNANAAAHANNHTFALQRFGAFLEMCHDVAREFLQARVCSRNGFELRPTHARNLRGVLLFLTLADFLQLLINFRIDEMLLDETRFVINRDNGLVSARLTNVVSVNDVAENGLRVAVRQINRCAGESDKGGVRQRIAEIFGKAVSGIEFVGLFVTQESGFKAVLRAMRFVGNDDDVAAVGEFRMFAFALRQAEFFNRGENDFAAFGLQRFAQVAHRFRLFHVAYQRARGDEILEKLIV